MCLCPYSFPIPENEPAAWKILDCVPSTIPALIYVFIFVVLGLELRAFTLSHFTNPIFVKGFLR
jgi:hypothetical protein